jgi:hypothetical protein
MKSILTNSYGGPMMNLMNNTDNIGRTVTKGGKTGTVIDFDRYTFAVPMYVVRFEDDSRGFFQPCEIGVASWSCNHSACSAARALIGRMWAA